MLSALCTLRHASSDVTYAQYATTSPELYMILLQFKQLKIHDLKLITVLCRYAPCLVD